MAAGTVVSRLTGFARAAVIAAALGLGMSADVFNVPNVIPNMLYILVGGGVLNSVLVPVLVRAIKSDADGGEAYSQRLFSVTVVVLGVSTILAVLAAPLLVRLLVDSAYLEPDMRPHFDNMVAFARFCLPQIFFYGLYVLVGQILNAHGRFGPMMWSPILNNVIAIAVFTAYLLVLGAKDSEPFGMGEISLLGLGSTVAVAAQALALVPVLRRMGFSLRFRTDWRGHGLRKPIRLGAWSVGFVVVNQIAYLFFVSIATGASATAPTDAVPGEAGGYTVYANAMLIMMVPHAIVTVSLATALLPRLSDEMSGGRIDEARGQLVAGIRASLAIIIPVAALLGALATPLTELLFSHGAAAGQTQALADTLTVLLPGLVAFTVHYLCLRGFFAMQDTRTPFFNQVWIAATMVVWALCLAVVDPPSFVVTELLGAGYSFAYIVGATLSLIRLQRDIGPLGVGAIVQQMVRLLIVGALTAGVAWMVHGWVSGIVDGWAEIGLLLDLGVSSGIGAAVFIVLAHVFRIAEVRDAVAAVRQRWAGRAEAPAPAPGEDLEETAEHPAPLPEGRPASPFRRPAAAPGVAPGVGLDIGLDETMHEATMHGVMAQPGEALPDGVGEGRRYQLAAMINDATGVQTWRGWDTLLGRQVAVQAVPASDTRARPFVQAAQRAAVVNDRRFPRILDVGSDDVAYVISEWTQGRRLADVVANGSLAAGEARSIEQELSGALAVAHQHGLHHQRLTPAHVYLTLDGSIKIAGLETDAALFAPEGDGDPAELDARGIDRVVGACFEGYGPAARGDVVPGLHEDVGVRLSSRERHARQARRFIGVITAIALLGGATFFGLRMLLQAIDSPSSEPSNSGSSDGSDDTAPPSDRPSPTRTPTPAAPAELDIAGADYFDPEGESPENPEDVGNATDGDPETAWSTLTYFDPLEEQKSGVGLYVDLGAPQAISEIDVAFDEGGGDVEIRALEPDVADVPDAIDDWSVVGEVENAEPAVTISLDEPATSRYLLVWFTRLPGGGGDFRDGIAELTVTGRPAAD